MQNVTSEKKNNAKSSIYRREKEPNFFFFVSLFPHTIMTETSISGLRGPKSMYFMEIVDVSSQESSVLSSIVESFTSAVSASNLGVYSEEVLCDIKLSLKENSPITMLPNYNVSPTGNEHGQYLVIDLGGSTLRIAVVDISKPHPNLSRSERITIVVEKSWIIGNDFKRIDGEFFKYIGSKINEILVGQNVIDVKSVINTGITWSFPLETTDYNRGKIKHVSKGYTVGEDIYDKDLKMVLEDTLRQEYGLTLDVQSILNDSLAVYSAGCFIDSKMKLAMVLGTGINMCCSLKRSSDIHPSKMLADATLFNCELSLFGQNLCKDFATKYDIIIDKRFAGLLHHFKTFMEPDPITKTLFQPHELMTSGRYLPELTRLVVVDLIEAGEIFQNVDHQQMYQEYGGFSGELICFVHENDDYDDIHDKLCKAYGWTTVGLSDIVCLKEVVSCIIKRAAFIVANAIIAFFKLLGSDELGGDVTIGYVGSVLNYFHKYRRLIVEYVNNAEEAKGIKVDLKLIENSSIIGAAIGAAYHK